MRTLIVDDEPLARRGIALRLERFAFIRLLGEAVDGPSAVQEIISQSPDLVILDVQMPGLSGFEVLRALPQGAMPRVIFVTAFDQHALRAFEVQALDYLLKPISDRRFQLAIERAHRDFAGDTLSKSEARIEALLKTECPPYTSRFTVRVGDRIRIVSQQDVLWIAAAGDYAELHTLSGVHLVRETMQALEQRLDPVSFVRIHRSKMVRLDRIVGALVLSNGEYLIRLDDASEHRCSRTYSPSLTEWLGRK